MNFKWLHNIASKARFSKLVLLLLHCLRWEFSQAFICLCFPLFLILSNVACEGLPDIDCDDSDRISAQSTPSPQTRQFQMIVPSKLQPAVSVSSTYHPSLRKKKWLERTAPQPLARQSTLEKDWLMQTTTDVTQQHRPVSMLTVSPSESNVIANKVAGTLLQQVVCQLISKFFLVYACIVLLYIQNTFDAFLFDSLISIDHFILLTFSICHVWCTLRSSLPSIIF